jgi:hypothetical protein
MPLGPLWKRISAEFGFILTFKVGLCKFYLTKRADFAENFLTRILFNLMLTEFDEHKK